MQNLTLLAKEIHSGNVARGFYEVQPTLKTQLMLVITELSEAVEADRKGRYSHALFVGTEMDTQSFEENIKDTFEDEIADAFIRLLDIAGNRHINIVEYTSKYPGSYRTESKCDTIFNLCSEITKDTIIENISDIIDDIIQMCESWNIDLNFHVTEKLKYNSTRPYKHGKNY